MPVLILLSGGRYGRRPELDGAMVDELVNGAEIAPAERVVREGIWVADNGLATVDVGLRDAWLQVDLFACQYGGVTPACDADLAQMGVLIKELGYTGIGETKIEDSVVMLELL